MPSGCPACADTGWKPAVRADGSPAVAPCDCQTPVAVPASLAEVGVPAQLRDSARFEYFDEISEPLRRAKEAVRKWADAYPDVKAGLVLTGPAGAGKTHLAVAALRRILLERKIAARARFVYLPQLLREMQGTWKDALLAEKRMLGSVTSAEILVLDQLGADMGARWAEEKEDKLLYILTRCFQNGGLLLCTTVYPFRPSGHQTALAERITARAVSLLREACRAVPVSGDDYRDTVLRHGPSV